MKWLKQYLARDEKNQTERLERMYGSGSYQTAIIKNRKSTILWLVITISLLLIIGIVQKIEANPVTHQLVLDENGNIKSIIRPTLEEGPLLVEAVVTTKEGAQLSDSGVSLVIQPLEKNTDKLDDSNSISTKEKKDITAHEIRKVVYQVNDDVSQSSIALPKKLENGTVIRWNQKKKQSFPFLLLIGIFSSIAIIRSRNSGIMKQEKLVRASIIKELPEFVNKLILLINAGLILSNAFHKIVIDYQKTRGGENNYFYSQLTGIMTNTQENNGSLIVEFRNFAVRSGVVEFMRLANIINDSMTKGYDLMGQLKMEGDSLWNARRKLAEERGKIAETKLTFPLVILLLVLVMITIAPAMMEM
jgi:tight adherence protein C